MKIDADVAIVGSGFAGSLTALCLRARGKRVVMVERGRHPRFAIGESSTPLANLLIEELAARYDLPRIGVFSKWGTWQRARPDVGGGLKRGFSFYFHRPGEPFADDDEHARQLLVAASPHDDIGDTHWYRPDFDHNLVREAEESGALYLDETELAGIDLEADGARLHGTRRGQTGPHRRVVCRRRERPSRIPRTGPRSRRAAAHVAAADSRAVHALRARRALGRSRAHRDGAPYPPDLAALHHVFPGGWIWVLRFANGITSAGAALTDPVAGRLGAADGAPAWDRLLATLPTVREQFGQARAVLPWIHAPRLAFRTRRVCGGELGAAAVGSRRHRPAARRRAFRSTLLGIGRLLELLEHTSPGAERDAALRRYERVTLDELDATEQLVAALYANMSDVPLFKRLTLLYFAAASYAETARRLGRPDLAPGFLLSRAPCLRPGAARLRGGWPRPFRRALREALLARIDRAIAPFDVAGLRDPSRRDWYPVLAADLFANASKLQATAGEVEALLERCGFAARSDSMNSETGPTRNRA